jgi:hypothetical protein
MRLNIIDPLDSSITYSDPQTTLVLGFSNPETRKMNWEYMTVCCCQVFDIYRDPEALLPFTLKIPCFARLIDYATYLRVEANLTEYIKDVDAENLPPTIIYGVERRPLLENLSIIDVAKLHPDFLSCFFKTKIKRI